MTGEAEAPARRFSPIVLIVIIMVLVLSTFSLFQAIMAYDIDPTGSGFLIYLLIGVIGLSLSTYLLFQTRRRMRRFTLKIQPVNTTIVCSKCGFKNVRTFERGDYILKKAGQCTKCKEPMIISAIYREVKEKGKEEKVFT